MRWTSAFLVVGLVLGLAGVVLVREEAPASVEPASSSEEASPRFRLGEIDRAAASSVSEAPVDARPIPPLDPRDDDDEETHRRRLGGSTTEAHRVALQLGRQIEDAIAREAADPQWSEEVESAFRRSFVELALDDAFLVEVRCSARYCAAGVGHRDRDASQEIFSAARATEAVAGHAMVRRDRAEHGYTTWYYLSRGEIPLLEGTQEG